MRSTTVPAQITTVEDRIVGNLSITQLILLMAPVLLLTLVFVALPPANNMVPYKIVMTVPAFMLFAGLALRLRGKILLLWLIVLLKYVLRPRVYVFNKNDSYLRGDIDLKSEITNHDLPTKIEQSSQNPVVSVADRVQLEQILSSQKANVRFLRDRKGGLRVHITEAKE